jgi:hypothetical protein
MITMIGRPEHSDETCVRAAVGSYDAHGAAASTTCCAVQAAVGCSVMLK